MPLLGTPSPSANQTIHAIDSILDLIKRKKRLCQILDAEETTPAEKHEIIVQLASLTGILASAG
jgi:hypothetical protein